VSQVAVEKVKGTEAPGTGILEEIRNLSERIRERAFELFQHRGGEAGHDLEDWLLAEQDFIRSPQSELIENDRTLVFRLHAPGFQADEIKVTVLPDALVVKAESHNEHETKEGKLHFSEFGQKMLFRHYPLPGPIIIEKVTASLDNGVLQLTVPKAKQALVAKTAAA
jgi:HSP20 family molecular chaperone IbpA